MYFYPLLIFLCLLLVLLLLLWSLRQLTSRAPPASARVPGTSHPYGFSESIGRRERMEDRHVVLPLRGGLPSYSGPTGLPPTLYGVFDGHAGSAAADFCSTSLGSVLLTDSAWPAQPEACLTNAFHVLDASFLELARLHRPPLNDGTTAVCALTLGRRILVANAGDSRAVLVQRDGRAHALSQDHKPNRPDEVRRIQALGGSVFFHGVWRVSGVLAVSRAIGDRTLKPYVSATPELAWWECTPQDAALVLACDGLWDVLSNEQVAEVVLAAMHPLPGGVEEPHTPAQRASAALVRHAIMSGSMDNVTAIVVDLRQGGAGGGGALAGPRPGARAAEAVGGGVEVLLPTEAGGGEQLPSGSEEGLQEAAAWGASGRKLRSD
jgi:protein phosphatase 1L